MKGREMQRHVGAEPIHYPGALRFNFTGRVVLARNEQSGDLEPHVGLTLQVLKRLEDGSELAGAEILVKSVGEAFEVDIGGIHVPKKFGPWFGRNITRADSYCLDTPPTTGLRHIDRIFKKDHRVVVSKSDRSAATSHRGLCNHLGRGHILNAIKIPSLRDVPVLILKCCCSDVTGIDVASVRQ